jgi:hypothetical protein
MYATSVGKHLLHPNSRQGNFFRRLTGRLGLDFLVAVLKYVSHQLGRYTRDTMYVSGLLPSLTSSVPVQTCSTPTLLEPQCQARVSSLF